MNVSPKTRSTQARFLRVAPSTGDSFADGHFGGVSLLFNHLVSMGGAVGQVSIRQVVNRRGQHLPAIHRAGCRATSLGAAVRTRHAPRHQLAPAS